HPDSDALDQRRGDDGANVPADGDGGEPLSDRGHRARAGRAGHGADPGDRLPDVPGGTPALGRHDGPTDRAGEAEEVRAPRQAFRADAADEGPGQSGAGLLRLSGIAPSRPDATPLLRPLPILPTALVPQRR